MKKTLYAQRGESMSAGRCGWVGDVVEGVCKRKVFFFCCRAVRNGRPNSVMCGSFWDSVQISPNDENSQ